MARLLIHVEGHTEETFVNEVLAPHLFQFGYSNVSARLLGNARMRSRRGGIGSWNAVREDILNHLKEDSGSLSTMMVDYYALPQSGGGAWPSRAESTLLAFENKAELIQTSIHSEICIEMGVNFDHGRFIPYIMMYEFEGLLFSNPQGFSKGIGRTDLATEFQRIRALFATPEEINDSPQTAPSKRILNLIPNYEKPLMGTLAILEIGLNNIRRECPLFNNWVRRLEQGCVSKA
jgi:Domain of unknown function (DUF4276)